MLILPQSTAKGVFDFCLFFAFFSRFKHLSSSRSLRKEMTALQANVSLHYQDTILAFLSCSNSGF